MAAPTRLALNDSFLSIAGVIRFATAFTVQLGPIPEGHVLYDHHELVKMFYTLTKGFVPLRLNQSGVLHITFKADRKELDINITWRSLILSCARWERLFNLLHDEDVYEYLREFGGSIEPLTWDEGYGQGVIVRLPWV